MLKFHLEKEEGLQPAAEWVMWEGAGEGIFKERSFLSSTPFSCLI